MNAKAIFASLALTLLLLTAGTSTFSQTANAPLPPKSTALGQLEPLPSTTATTPEMEAERAKIWNSPSMLRARAWAQEYCQRSAKITPEEAQDYMTELQRMTPKQMKLWLLKFDEQDEMIRQQQAAFNQTRQDSLNQAMAVDRNIQKSYGRINKDETEAAEGEQASINEENENEQTNSRDDEQSLDTDAAADRSLGGLGGLGYGYGYGYGAAPAAPVHYHYHFHY